MKRYRFYFLGTDGHVVKRLDRQAADDVTALEAAIPMSAEQPIEIWQAKRRVAKLLKGAAAAPFEEPSSREDG